MVDTMIRLFDSTAMSFLSNGLGTLSDASKCEVVEERNGSFELELEYHISGKRYSDLELRRIIVAKPNPYAKPQPFRIYNISKPMNGLVTVKAEHISYDMTGYPLSPFKAQNVAEAFKNLKEHSIVECPFVFSTDKDTESELELVKPASMRSMLGGSDQSILDIYGGEYEFNGYQVILHEQRGSNHGVTIRYGKNMTDLTQEENCSNVYTAVYPFFYSEEWGMVELPEKIVPAPGTYNYTRIYPLDVSSEWENLYEWEDQYPSEDEIREIAVQYMSDNKIGVPAVSLTVSFEQLSQSGEYAALNMLETVCLCDTVNVEFPKLNVSAVSKCIKTTYDVLTGKYVSIELGESKADLASTIASNNAVVTEKLNSRPTKSFITQAVEKATSLISGGLGGYVVMHNSKGGVYPDEILIMDTPEIKTATKIWRWNKGGLGYSYNGYDGPYGTAITQDGEIVADFVKTGHLTANIIQGGTFTVGGVDNTDGTIAVRNSQGELLLKLSVDGIEFYGNGGENITAIVKDTLKTTNVIAENLQIKAANVTGKLIAEQIDATELTAAHIEYSDDVYECTLSDGFTIRNKSESAATSYSIYGKDGSMSLFAGSLDFYTGENFNGVHGTFWHDSQGFHFSRSIDIGTGSVNAGTDGNATIVDCTSNGNFYFGASADYTDESSLTALRGKTVRIFSHKDGAVYLGSSGAVAVTSDEKLKDIYEIDSRYEDFFMKLAPVLYSYKGNGHRKHIGYGARAVENALKESGLTTEDFAGILIDKDMTISADEMGTEEDVYFEELYSLRYEEFGALYAHMLQRALEKIECLEVELRKLKQQVEERM